MSDICKCTFAIRMNGDGCRHCQPQGYIDRLEDQDKDHADRIERLEAVLLLARESLEYHERQTRPIEETTQTIAAIDAALKE